jgi:hypothetical protein
MGEGVRSGGNSRPLAVMRRIARWQSRSYLQIWGIAVAGYLACVVIYTAALGWPRSGGLAFVAASVGWLGAASGQSYRLHRRRTG